MKISAEQLELVKAQLKRLVQTGHFYGKRIEGIDIDAIQTAEDFEKLPFCSKEDLREAYPLGLMAVPEEEIVSLLLPEIFLN